MATLATDVSFVVIHVGELELAASRLQLGPSQAGSVSSIAQSVSRIVAAPEQRTMIKVATAANMPTIAARGTASTAAPRFQRVAHAKPITAAVATSATATS